MNVPIRQRYGAMRAAVTDFTMAAADVTAAVFPFDYRNVRPALRELPPDAYARASAAIVNRPARTAFVVSGFPMRGTAETDGPPGARAVGQALVTLGWKVIGICCPTTAPVISTIFETVGQVVAVDAQTSAQASMACRQLHLEHRPDVVVVIERPGQTKDGTLVNMRGETLGDDVPPLDAIVHAPLSIGIGDGGNEIGMGAIAAFLARTQAVANPCVTRTTHVLLASVSNWGALGLVTMMQVMTGRAVLPSDAAFSEWTRAIMRAGAIDGITRAPGLTVDGLPLTRSLAVLNDLRQIAHRYAPKTAPSA